jgi:hypothetical protein
VLQFVRDSALAFRARVEDPAIHADEVTEIKKPRQTYE